MLRFSDPLPLEPPVIVQDRFPFHMRLLPRLDECLLAARRSEIITPVPFAPGVLLQILHFAPTELRLMQSLQTSAPPELTAVAMNLR